ncbi:MAG: hypothetical protein J0M12_11405, partial [Deltaproteobacteria bacterium]|nr:hypothetical protein [Deltaproteobacteria bacterium]
MRLPTPAKPLLLLLLSFAMAVGLCTAGTAQAQSPKALFEVSIGGSRFTIQVQGRRAIEEARRILRKKQSPLIIGRVVRSRASYNRGWAFHL